MEKTETTEKAEIIGKGEIEVEESIYRVQLACPYSFEGNTYKEIDLSGLKELTGNDMVQANRHLSTTGNSDFIREYTLEFMLELAARATQMPVEFFLGLPPREVMQVRNRVMGFLFRSE